MKDRLIPGIIAGATAGAVMDLVSIIAYYLRWSTLRNLDWASIIVYGHPPRSTIEILLGEVFHLAWTTLHGVIFAYLSRALVPTRHRIVRGVSYGVFVWLVIYAATLLFKVPYVLIVSWKTALSNFVTAMIFGATLAYVLGRLLDEARI